MVLRVKKARDYYAGGYRAMLGGVPIRLAFKPSAHALAVMREGEPSRGGARELQESMAESYARWLAARDGIDLAADAKVKAFAVWETPEGKSWKERRVSAVRFEVGYETQGSWCSGTPARWECEEVLATIAIPHWDHEPVVTSPRQPAPHESHAMLS